jgi:hypothetical protein
MRTHVILSLALLAACGGQPSEPEHDISLMSNPDFDLFACDADGDGILAISCGGRDCLDSDPSIHFGAEEIVNDGIDQDCNGADAVDCDIDGDGAIDPFCFDGDDCDPLDPDIDEQRTFYPDADGDGFRVLEGAITACEAPEGFGTLDPEVDVLDCDDNAATAFPGNRIEICGDGLDNDCDGNLDPCDELVPTTQCDADGDGHESIACGGDDCFDSSVQIFAGAPEIPNDGIDQDCNGIDLFLCDLDLDGVIDPYCAGFDCDDSDPPVGEIVHTVDADGDGFGGMDDPTITCNPAPGYSPAGDCNDDEASVYPGAPEVCGDGFDNGCDGQRDACDPFFVLPTSFCGTEIQAGNLQDFGRSLTSADFNGDGVQDLVIGANQGGTGVVVIIDGTASGTVVAQEEATLAILHGDTADGWGDGITAGDFTGDGVTDVAIGEPDAFGSGARCAPTGRASVYPGPFLGTSWTPAAPTPDFVSSDGFVFEGFATTSADVAAGTPCHKDSLGWRLAAVDLNDDGTDDLVASGSWPADAQLSLAASFFHGPINAGGSFLDATGGIRATVDGDAGDDERVIVASAGDVNGDGVEDLVMTHPEHDTLDGDDVGAAYFFYGPIRRNRTLATANADAVIFGTRAGVALGVLSSAATLDVNRDGADDLLLGEHGGVGGEGAVRLYLGPITGTLTSDNAVATWTGENIGDLAGDAVFAGDINGDNLPDLVMGAQAADRFGQGGGAAYVLFGPSLGGSLGAADVVIEGATGTETGTWVAAMGDATGDGLAEFAVASPSSTGGSVFICGADR